VLLTGPKATVRALREGVHKKPGLPRFVFLVHALTPAHKRILGARFSDPELMAGGKGLGGARAALPHRRRGPGPR
jgi:hypothetical protein